METIKALFNGEHFYPTQPIPVKGNYEVIITFLEPIENNNRLSVRPPFEYGSMPGKMWIADDFDAPLDDFKEYME